MAAGAVVTERARRRHRVLCSELMKTTVLFENSKRCHFHLSKNLRSIDAITPADLCRAVKEPLNSSSGRLEQILLRPTLRHDPADQISTSAGIGKSLWCSTAFFALGAINGFPPRLSVFTIERGYRHITAGNTPTPFLSLDLADVITEDCH